MVSADVFGVVDVFKAVAVFKVADVGTVVFGDGGRHLLFPFPLITCQLVVLLLLSYPRLGKHGDGH